MRPSFSLVLFLTAMALCPTYAFSQSGAQLPPRTSVETRPLDKPQDFQSVADEVTICSKMQITDTKLRCYDEIAVRIEEKLRNMAVRSRFAWKSQRIGERDPKTLMIAIASTDGIWGTDTVAYRNSMFFTMTCKAGNTSFYVLFPKKVPDNFVSLSVRAGNDVSKVKVEASVSEMAMGVWDISSRDFINLASQNDSVSFNFHFSDVNIMAHFDLIGMASEVKKIYAECPTG